MIKHIIFVIFFLHAKSQEFIKMSDFVKHNPSFELSIISKSESYTDALINDKDSIKTEYLIRFINKEKSNYRFSVLYKQENQKHKRLLPEFSEVYMSFNSYGELVDLAGLDILENKFHALMNQLIEERGLVQNESAKYLKYLVSNPEILKSIYFSNVLSFFQFFQKGLIENLDKEENIKLKNPLNNEPLNAIQIKRIRKTKDEHLLSISQKIKNYDITKTMQKITKNDAFYVQYILNYEITLSYLKSHKHRPKHLKIRKNVKINNQDKRNHLDIFLAPILER